eukprot:TCONS_00004887-protein
MKAAQIISLILSTTICLLIFNQNVVTCLKNEKLHHVHRSIRKRDLWRIFGVEDPTKVPPYEIFSPFIHEGSSIRIDDDRRKRSMDKSNSYRGEIKTRTLRLGIPAFDKIHHLNMTQNKQLLTRNFKVEVLKQNGVKVVKREVEGNCYFHGNVQGDFLSLAAMSICYGQLRGMFTDEKEHYFVEPVPHYLHHMHGEIHEKPHIVFRRSLEETSTKYSGMFGSLLKKRSTEKPCGTKKNPHIRLARSATSTATDSKPTSSQSKTATTKTSNTKTTSEKEEEIEEEEEKKDTELDNNERYIEALAVVDQKMVNYHGEDAATQFALVVMNNVARLLRDASIGQNLVILGLNKLQLHTVDVPGLVINHHARNTLKSFGNWAQLSSDVDDRSDDHFDYAMLLTRYNICADRNQACDTRGLTETGGMCQWPYSASVNEDNGFELVYTVAHNIGHSLGMNHDGDESSFICPDNEYLMASNINPEDWKDNRNHWSRCSRNYLRQFLKKDQSKCLNDVPVFAHEVDYEKMDNKPGLLYDVSKQCEMQYGTGSKLCTRNMENICSTMSCTNPSNPDKCFRSLYPAADGTKCAENKFCYHGRCIATSSEMHATDGGWSTWADDYQACSRSCGGGVQFRQRHCTAPRPSNGGKYCEGESRTYRLCNTQKCGNGTTSPSYRSFQCSNLNGRLFGERKFEWEFKPSKIASCELGCFIAQTGHGYNFGNVMDGTNCDQTDDGMFSDKCINGQCVPVGCDKKLGSSVKFDRCGVCDGDGLTCVTGSERSNIAEASNSAGGIADALKSLKDMGFNMNNLYGKSSLELSSSSKRSDISSSGAAKKEEYGWSKIKSGCSTSCGGGIETLTAECRRLDDGSPVRENHCDQRSKPPTQQYPCKEEACPPIYQTSYWGDCSKTCNAGFKRRNVRCVQKSANGIEFDLDMNMCSGARPTDTEACNKEPCPAEWIAQPFGECSTICGSGVQNRDVLCQKTLKDGSLVTLHHDDCRQDTKPPTEQRCNVHNPCPGDDGCGGIYTDRVGNFTSPGYPNKYPSDMECVHIIQVPKENVIKLNFERMNIASPDKDCKNDFVKVMDGDCVSRLGESKFCGNSIPPLFISTTNRLCVKFFSDDSKSDDGFLARYTAIDKPTQSQDQCNSNLTAPDGLISSPNYPEFYPQNEECNVTITTEERPIRVKFHAFDVGNEGCDSDYVILSGGEESKKFCGQKLPSEYVSKENVINVRFVSTSHQNQLKPGFVATYTSGSPESARRRNNIPKPVVIKNDTLLTKKSIIPKEANSTFSIKAAFINTTNSIDTIAKDVQISNRHEIKTAKFPTKQNTTVQLNRIKINNNTNALLNVTKGSIQNTSDTTVTNQTLSNLKPNSINTTLDKMSNVTNLLSNRTKTITDQSKSSVNGANQSTSVKGTNQVAFIKSTQSDEIDMEVNSGRQTNDKKDMISSFTKESGNKRNDVVFTKSTQNDQVNAEIQSRVDKLKKEGKHLTKDQRLFLEAMKDDTPKWIPEPALPIINKTITVRKRNHTNRHPHHQNVKKDQIARPNANENERTHEIKIKATSENTQTKKDMISKHEIEMKKKISSKKLYITKPINYQNNLDGNLGECPSSLRCMDLLLSYPCTYDDHCGPGLSCCQTACGYFQKMCLPKITRHCPLQLPLMGHRVPCHAEGDCPLRHTCCLDLANNKYCRSLRED